MVGKFIKGLFGRGQRQRETEELTEEQLSNIRSVVERRLEENKMDKITKTMKVVATKGDSDFWEVVTRYEETRQKKNKKPEDASFSVKILDKDLDSAIADGWFTILTALSKYGGDVFKYKEETEKED